MIQESIIAFMPIKPVYAEKIINGSKKFEFRRAPIRSDLTHIIIYSSSPVKKIIGVAEVEKVIVDAPSAIWEKTKNNAGISRNEFRKYFHGKKYAFTICVKRIISLQIPISPSEIMNNFRIPQSFSYVDCDFLENALSIGTSEIMTLENDENKNFEDVEFEYASFCKQD